MQELISNILSGMSYGSVYALLAVGLVLTYKTSGIFNLGTGRAQTFNDVASAVVNSRRRHEGSPVLTLDQMVVEGLIEYVAFPEALKGKYQSFTQADIGRLRAAGYAAPFLTVEEGVSRYAEWLAGD